MTTLIILNENMDDIMKIIKCLEVFRLLINCVSKKKIKMKQKAKRRKGMSLGTLGPN